METQQKRGAGFWIASCAQLIDLALVVGVVVLAAEVVAGWGLYIPIEIVVIAVYLAYTAAAIAWKGRTLGQASLGLWVIRPDGASVGPMRALVHVGTVVVRPERLIRQHRPAFAVVLILVGTYVVSFAFGMYRLYRMHRAWIADADAAVGRTYEPEGDRIEAASMTAADRQKMADWLAEHGEDPAKTLIELASIHQATIVGEIHGRKPYLEFFNDIIPDLYRKAGVRVLALEFCPADENENLARLVESRQFDRGLLMTVARRAPWGAWGYKGYWDVLETVWRVNQSRPQGSEPLRVVGISPRFDGPSWTLVREGAWYEKLRIVRLGDVISGMFCNAYYARCVEREAFDKGWRTVAWVGAAHAALCPFGRGEFGHRMGSLLVGRYGTAVGQVILHGETEADGVARLIEDAAKQCGRTRVAFTTADSLFAGLRDGQAIEYRYRPGRGLADLAPHYIMLTPEEGLGQCDWLEGFLSRRMLGWNRPYYEFLAGGPIDDLEEGNRRIAQGVQHL